MRCHRSPTFWKAPLGKDKTQQHKRKVFFLKSTEKSRMQKFKTPGKILIPKTWLNFWGVTNTNPLKKNLALEIC